MIPYSKRHVCLFLFATIWNTIVLIVIIIFMIFSTNNNIASKTTTDDYKVAQSQKLVFYTLPEIQCHYASL